MAGDEAWRSQVAALERLTPIDPTGVTTEAHGLVAFAEINGDLCLRARAKVVLAKLALNDWDLTLARSLLDDSSALLSSAVVEDALSFKVVKAELLSKTHRVEASLALSSEIVQETVHLIDAGEAGESILWLCWKATFLNSIGHRDLGHFDESLQVLDTLDDIPVPADDEVLPVMLLANRAHAFADLGRLAEGAEAFERAREQFARLGAEIYERRAAVHLAHVLAQQGLFGRALTVMHEARSHYEHHDVDDGDWNKAAYDLDSARLVMADVYFMMGATDKALELLSAAIPTVTEWNRARDIRRVFMMSAELVAESSPEQARELLESLIELASERNDRIAMARVGMRIFELIPGHKNPALVELITATIEDIGSDTDVVRLSLLRAERCPPEETREHLDRAAEAIQQCSDPNLLWQFHFRVGSFALAEGQLEDARNSLHTAVGILRELWSSIPDERLRFRHRSAHTHVVDELTRALLELGLAEELFELIEQTYAVTLHERIHGMVPPAEWPTVCAELSVIYREMAEADPSEWPQLNLRAIEIEQARTAGSTSTAVVDQSSVKPDAAVPPEYCAVYGICDDEVFALYREFDLPPVLVRNLTTRQRLERLQLELDLQRQRCNVSTLQAHTPQLEAITNALLEELFDLLVGPPYRELGLDPQNPPKPEWGIQVVFVPPPGFDDLPFAAFRVGGVPLVSYAATCIAPSTSLASWAGGRARKGRATLAVGIATDKLTFPELEAIEIAEAVDGRVLVGSEATIGRLSSLVPQFDVVHIATHGVARTDDPWFNGVHLADGWLTATELNEWELDGQIIILSGCDTGQQSAPGHELLGLPRAFLAAGAGGVIAATSELDDERAASFMVKLHQNLANSGPAEALRQTQAEFASAGADLRQWASMAYIGGADRVVVPANSRDLTRSSVTPV